MDNQKIKPHIDVQDNDKAPVDVGPSPQEHGPAETDVGLICRREWPTMDDWEHKRVLGNLMFAGGARKTNEMCGPKRRGGHLRRRARDGGLENNKSIPDLEAKIVELPTEEPEDMSGGPKRVRAGKRPRLRGTLVWPKTGTAGAMWRPPRGLGRDFTSVGVRGAHKLPVWRHRCGLQGGPTKACTQTAGVKSGAAKLGQQGCRQQKPCNKPEQTSCMLLTQQWTELRTFVSNVISA